MKLYQFVSGANNQKTKYSPLLWLGVSSVITIGVAGCLGDQNVDDYRAEQVNQELALIQSKVQGTWTGTIVSAQDQLALGTVSMDLEPDTDVQNSSDNISTEQHASIQGTLTYSGSSNANIVFDQGYYDDDNGVFQATIPITTSAGTTVNLVVEGTISGSTLTGDIQSDGYPAYQGNITLTRNGPAPSSQGLVTSARLSEITTGPMVYSGKDSAGSTVIMTLLNLDVNPGQMFMDVFQPSQDLQVNLDLTADAAQQSAGASMKPAQLLFTDGFLDETTGTLKANTINSGESGSKIEMTLSCQENSGGTPSFTCVTLGDQAIQDKFTVSLTDAASATQN